MSGKIIGIISPPERHSQVPSNCKITQDGNQITLTDDTSNRPFSESHNFDAVTDNFTDVINEVSNNESMRIISFGSEFSTPTITRIKEWSIQFINQRFQTNQSTSIPISAGLVYDKDVLDLLSLRPGKSEKFELVDSDDIYSAADLIDFSFEKFKRFKETVFVLHIGIEPFFEWVVVPRADGFVPTPSLTGLPPNEKLIFILKQFPTITESGITTGFDRFRKMSNIFKLVLDTFCDINTFWVFHFATDVTFKSNNALFKIAGYVSAIGHESNNFEISRSNLFDVHSEEEEVDFKGLDPELLSNYLTDQQRKEAEAEEKELQRKLNLMLSDDDDRKGRRRRVGKKKNDKGEYEYEYEYGTGKGLSGKKRRIRKKIQKPDGSYDYEYEYVPIEELRGRKRNRVKRPDGTYEYEYEYGPDEGTRRRKRNKVKKRVKKGPDGSNEYGYEYEYEYGDYYDDQYGDSDNEGRIAGGKGKGRRRRRKGQNADGADGEDIDAEDGLGDLGVMEALEERKKRRKKGKGKGRGDGTESTEGDAQSKKSEAESAKKAAEDEAKAKKAAEKAAEKEARDQKIKELLDQRKQNKKKDESSEQKKNKNKNKKGNGNQAISNFSAGSSLTSQRDKINMMMQKFRNQLAREGSDDIDDDYDLDEEEDDLEDMSFLNFDTTGMSYEEIQREKKKRLEKLKNKKRRAAYSKRRENEHELLRLQMLAINALALARRADPNSNQRGSSFLDDANEPSQIGKPTTVTDSELKSKDGEIVSELKKVGNARQKRVDELLALNKKLNDKRRRHEKYEGIIKERRALFLDIHNSIIQMKMEMPPPRVYRDDDDANGDGNDTGINGKGSGVNGRGSGINGKSSGINGKGGLDDLGSDNDDILNGSANDLKGAKGYGSTLKGAKKDRAIGKRKAYDASHAKKKKNFSDYKQTKMLLEREIENVKKDIKLIKRRQKAINHEI